MSPFRPLVLAAFFGASAFAQQFSHPVTASRDDAFLSTRTARALPDTVRILAVMVQFQSDNDNGTSGNGQFVLSSGGSPVIDAPPHNRAYFQDHLQFVGNYYRKSSKGKETVLWTVIDSVYSLPGLMSAYSPARNGSNLPLAQLARDTWQRVDASGRIPSFAAYNCFVLFHAGVGRDVDLVGSLGYDPAPRDIPSLTLGPTAFQSLLGSGIAVNGGAYTITNTLIIPETESRILPGAAGDFLLELGINGLLCASVGSYLGLPDLFDTKTGLSGIGRFGLMDGQAIFSFSGAFPPEPSAWEKSWLGWVNPVEIPAGTSLLSIPAVGLADTIYKVPISGSEYFLLENRSRDPGQNGQRVFSTLNGTPQVQGFRHDTTGFKSSDISVLSGTVTDVEDLDWSLPGGVGTDGTFYDGGILIWHIDEAVIQRTIADDAVNADPLHRGVNLEEADGSQDIGQQYGQFSSGTGSEEGTALDFWFKGSNSTVNKNEFSASTFPNSNSNQGGLTHITISNFSARSPHMTFTVRIGDALAPLKGFPRHAGESIGSPSITFADLGFRPGPEFLISAGQSLYAFEGDSTGALSFSRASGIVAATSGAGRRFLGAPAIADLNGDGRPDCIVVETTDSSLTGASLRAFSMTDANGDSLADQLFSLPIAPVLSPPVVSDSLIAVARHGALGVVYYVRFDGQFGASQQMMTTRPAGIARWVGSNAFVIADGPYIRISTRTPAGPEARPDLLQQLGADIVTPPVVGLFGRSPADAKPLIAFVTADGRLFLLDSTLTAVPGFPRGVGTPAGAPALADIDGDGVRDIVVLAGRSIMAVNVTGAMLDHFPVSVGAGFAATSPVIGDVDGDGKVDIVAVDSNGVAYAIDRNGRILPGFPLAVGGTGAQSAALMPANGAVDMVTASEDGSLSVWQVGRVSVSSGQQLYPWPQYGRDERHGARDLTLSAGAPLSNEFFPAARAYNWPNPAYSGKTYFRYYLGENASVSIRIFDLAGDQVTELHAQGSGGMDNEVAWDVTGVQSGIYFARIEATGQGKSGLTVVKVAIVK